MRYRAIRPIDGEIKMMPGEFVPDDAPKAWIKKHLKDDEIAVYGKEVKWQQEEQSDKSSQEST